MKRLILLIVVLSIVFIFSGCDALLEGFFPKATGTDRGEDATNTIEFGVSIDWDIFEHTKYRECNTPIIIQLEKFEGSYQPFDRREIWCSPDSYFVDRFEWLPDGEYRIIIFWDEDNSWDLSPGDANTFAYDYNMYGNNYVNVGGGSWYRLEGYIWSGSMDVTMP
jgi:hypothetical protein